jgi:hypothetical protein
MTETPTILDMLKYRKLDNGYTVRYHVTKVLTPEQREAKEPDGFGGEMYVESLPHVKKATDMLLTKYMKAP